MLSPQDSGFIDLIRGGRVRLYSDDEGTLHALIRDGAEVSDAAFLAWVAAHRPSLLPHAPNYAKLFARLISRIDNDDVRAKYRDEFERRVEGMRNCRPSVATAAEMLVFEQMTEESRLRKVVNHDGDVD